MTTQSINQILAYLIPVIGLVLPGIFKSDGLPDHINGLIGFGVTVIIALIQSYFAGQLGWNVYIDMGLVVTGITTLRSGDFAWLDQYMQSNVGLTFRKPTALPPTPLVRRTSAPIEFPPSVTPPIPPVVDSPETH